MKPLTKFKITYILLLIFCAFIAWLGGYNFDTRSPDVAFFTAFSILISGFISLFLTMITIEK